MIKYLVLLLVYIVFFILAMLLAPLLPLFMELRDGPTDNNNARGLEPRLPLWLGWFDTAIDNSLWGDKGWRTKHCPDRWRYYDGMMRWLWRNPAAGFSWSVLAHAVDASDIFSLSSSGCGLNLDKARGQQGWFLIKSTGGAFQFRWVKAWGNWQMSFEAGWLLDVYLKDKRAVLTQPKALYQFQPRLVRNN